MERGLECAGEGWHLRYSVRAASGGAALSNYVGSAWPGIKHRGVAPAAMGSLGLGMMAGALRLPHGTGSESLWTVIGVGILALGHDLNRRATA